MNKLKKSIELHCVILFYKGNEKNGKLTIKN